jgi:Txe/YoeB family toxin of Txe-Axe toxin-antitoxin module
LSVRFTDRALRELMVLIQTHPKKAAKVIRLLELIGRDLRHPQLGKIEKLRHLEGYSIRIDPENRLIFSIIDHVINIHSLLGHYES